MARLNTRSVSTDADLTSSPRRRSTNSPTPASSIASGSDKENSSSSRRSSKRKSAGMSDSTPEPSSQKRRRLQNHGRSQNSQTLRKQLAEGQLDTRYYDPDQDPEERRRVKKGMRNLHSKLTDSRQEYLQPESTGLVDTLTQANKLYKSVKVTQDATLDARVLVDTADMSYKKIKNSTIGDTSIGIDVDEFVGKCLQFMRNGDAVEATQQRRRRQGDDDEEETGDTVNWGHLGKHACFLHNSRPCLSGFLLGPLSVKKKVRQQTQRRAKEANAAPSQLLRPIELSHEDLDKQEATSLSAVCTEVRSLLKRTQAVRQDLMELAVAKLGDKELSDEDALQLFHDHGLCRDGGLPFVEFCFNPKSFGQTVENIFFVSFLVKESKAGLSTDEDGRLSLLPTDAGTVQERQERQRNQVVFALDFDVWEDMVKTFDIKQSIIPHRKDEVHEDGVLPELGDIQLEAGTEVPVPDPPMIGAGDDDGEDSDMYG